MDVPGSYPSPSPYATEEPIFGIPGSQLGTRQDSSLDTKATDPRGHAHADSGVGILDRDLVQPATGGNSVINSDYTKRPSDSMGPPPAPMHSLEITANELSRTKTSEPLVGNPLTSTSTQQKPKTAQSAALATMAAPAASGTTSQKQVSQPQGSSANMNHSQDSPSAPYWGRLPTSTRGGIYNTITGHGSPQDAQDQHHEMPGQTRDGTKTLAEQRDNTLTTDVPDGGAPVSAVAAGHQAARSRQFPLGQHSDGLENESGATTTSRPMGNEQILSSAAAFASASDSTPGMPIRAGLATGPESRRDSSARELTVSAGSPPGSESRRKEGIAAAGVAGAGFAAAGLAEKHKSPEQRHYGFEQAQRDNIEVGTPGKLDGVAPNQSPKNHDYRRGHAADEQHGEEHHKEKKGGLLGLFHRHKDEKDSPTRTKSKLQKKSRGASRSREASPATPPNKKATSASGGANRSSGGSSDGSRESSEADQGNTGSKFAAVGVAAGAGLGATALARKHEKKTELTKDSATALAQGTSAMPSDSKAFTSEDAQGPASLSVPRKKLVTDTLRDRTRRITAGGSDQREDTKGDDAAPSTQPADTTGNTGPTYNVLSSGTPSGVKDGEGFTDREATSPRQQHASTGPAMMPTAAGASQARSHSAGNQPGAQFTRPSQDAAPVQSPYPRSSGAYQTPSSGAAPELRSNDGSVPSADSYNQTTPQAHDRRSRDIAVAAAPSGPSMAEERRFQPPGDKIGTDEAARREESPRSSALNPALAASQVAWPAHASSHGGPQLVVHKCQKCGEDNDISHYFSKERLSAMFD